MTDKTETILVVDDEEMLRRAMSLKLSSLGYTILQAANGEIGLECALRERPDLIVLDLMMPVMNGAEMLQQLRAHDEGLHIPVIFLSNISSVDEIPGINNFDNLKDLTNVISKSDTSLVKLAEIVEKTIETYKFLFANKK